MKITCEQCGKEKEVYPSYAKRRKHLFCSKKCFYAYQKEHKLLVNKARLKKIEITCAYCGAKKLIYLCYVRKNNFCDIKCRDNFKKGIDKN